MPPRLADTFEIAVAAMLIVLGVRSVLQAARLGPRGPARLHTHSWVVHQHSGLPAHVHIGKWTFARRPLLVGAIHGLAGSGALAALVLATLPSTAARLAYMALLPPLLAKTILRPFFIRMGFIRFFLLVTLIQFMAALPIKMVLRWTLNLKYIVYIPEFFFNI